MSTDTEMAWVSATDLTDTATVVVPDDAERVGLETLGAHPALVSAVIRLAERAAGRKSDMGDISAESVSLAVSMLAAHIGQEGLPVDERDRAILAAGIAKRAADRARDAARRQWNPRPKRAAADGTEAGPTSLSRWTQPALVRRAERYTAGSLDGTGPTDADGTVIGPWADATIPREWTFYSATVAKPRTLAAAILDAREESSLPRQYHGPKVPRHSGGTVPGAESTYWTQRRADVTASAIGAAFALAGVDAEMLTSADVWSRRGGIHWQTLADATGTPRGTVQSRVRSAARIARRVAAEVF